MMEQMVLFPDISTENDVYNVLLPFMENVLEKSNALKHGAKKYLQIIPRTGFSAVQYLKYDPFDENKEPSEQLIFRICFRKGKHYFGVSEKYLNGVPKDTWLPVSKVKGTGGFTNFDFEPTKLGIEGCSDFVAKIVEVFAYSILNDFDCCYRFEQCSDAGRCIHPNPAMATSCGYRKTLRDGKFFYGENRNIE